MQPTHDEAARTGDALLGSELGGGASFDGCGGAIFAPETPGEVFEDGCRGYDGGGDLL
ncbi:MAG TPA: hypothetical protein VFH06_00925 [Candidatus Saccharimonadales bacterium]|nr:hypothetical protein [Candidatus Saccharimonadales bacterium]